MCNGHKSDHDDFVSLGPMGGIELIFETSLTLVPMFIRQGTLTVFANIVSRFFMSYWEDEMKIGSPGDVRKCG